MRSGAGAGALIPDYNGKHSPALGVVAHVNQVEALFQLSQTCSGMTKTGQTKDMEIDSWNKVLYALGNGTGSSGATVAQAIVPHLPKVIQRNNRRRSY